MTPSGRRSRAIDAEHAVGDPKPIKAVGDEIDADRSDNQPGGVDRLAPVERDNGERDGAE